jgi:glucose/arabinose dehydrogenase
VNTKILRAGCSLIALLAASACDDKIAPPNTQFGAHPVLPAPQAYLVPPMQVPTAEGWQQGETPKVSADLKIQAFATGFKHPRMVYTLPNGDVLVVESNGPKPPVYRPKDYVEDKVKALAGASAPGANRITLLRDTNADGRADVRTTFVDHLNSPFGVVLVGNNLYVANTDAVVRFPYTPGETHIAAPGVRLTGLPGGPIDHHWTKSLTASPDGSKLYVGVGSNSNITENGIAAEYGRAAIYEVDRATGMKRIFAGGTRNPTGVAFEPLSGKLWAIVNERDEIGPNLVPDYLTSVKDGAFYGWPYSYFGHHVDVRVQPQRPDLVAKAIAPDYALSSHVAPLGLVFTEKTSLPERYRSGVFVGEHGSWDRSPLNGYKVVYIPFRNGRPNGPPQDVVTGFVTADGGETMGRPVGVTLDRTGALLIADDVGNAVWRVTNAPSASANSVAPKPRPTRKT